jgi:hypothetical protein
MTQGVMTPNPPSSPFNSILERGRKSVRIIAIFAFFFRYFSRLVRLLALLFSLFGHGARTIPRVARRSRRALSRLADGADFWTLDRTTITGRSAVILRHWKALGLSVSTPLLGRADEVIE